MPELPEVELVKRSLERTVEEKGIGAISFSDYIYKGHEVGRRTIIKENLESFKKKVDGAHIKKIGRRGKYLYFIMEKDGGIFHLISHLGMSGAFFVADSIEQIKDLNYRRHWQVSMPLSDGQSLVYSDIRRFGEMSTVDRMSDFPPFKRMALEYTHPDSLAEFIEKIKDPSRSNKAIKALIMDSTVIPGVGNIYASEALFMSGISPVRKAGNISVERLTKLHQASVEVFELSLSRGGSTISDYRGISGERGSMQDRFKVYQKKVCPDCEAPLKTKTIAGRNTFYCTNCQR